jgi:hypothetical protein
MPRTNPFKSNPWTALTSISTKPQKNGTLYVVISRVIHLVDLQVLESLSHIVLKYFEIRNVQFTKTTHLQALEHIA